MLGRVSLGVPHAREDAASHHSPGVWKTEKLEQAPPQVWWILNLGVNQLKLYLYAIDCKNIRPMTRLGLFKESRRHWFYGRFRC